MWFLQEEPTTVQNFRLSTAQVKFHQDLYFDRLLLLEVYKVSAKKNGGVMSHDTKQWCKI